MAEVETDKIVHYLSRRIESLRKMKNKMQDEEDSSPHYFFIRGRLASLIELHHLLGVLQSDYPDSYKEYYLMDTLGIKSF